MEKIKIKCNCCQIFTFHKVIHEYEQNLSEDHFFCKLKFRLLECCGCQDVKMEREETSDYCSFNESGTIPEIVVYPPYTFRRKPSWLSNLIFPFNAKTGSVNKEIINLIDEVYIALQNGCNRLSVMGVRALIEHVMIQKVGDQRSFMKNMNAFQDQGFISKVQRQALDHVLNAGHAAIHRSYNPKINEVIAAIDIVENILESIYTVDKRQNCFKNVPSRKTT